MQTVKKDIKRQLVETARRLFLQKGYKSVTMRLVAQQSGVGLSNIYNYFPAKERLLAEVVRPAISALDALLDSEVAPDKYPKEAVFDEALQMRYLQPFLKMVTTYRDELRLLFTNSVDTPFDDFFDRWINRSEQAGHRYLAHLNDSYPDLHTDVSPLFLRTSCYLWLAVLREAVMHKELDRTELEHFFADYIRYGTGGWERLLCRSGVKSENLPIIQNEYAIVHQKETIYSHEHNDV